MEKREGESRKIGGQTGNEIINPERGRRDVTFAPQAFCEIAEEQILLSYWTRIHKNLEAKAYAQQQSEVMIRPLNEGCNVEFMF